MHQRPLLEPEDRIAPAAVCAILLARIFGALAGQRVFQLHRDKGKPIDRQHHVKHAFALRPVRALQHVRHKFHLPGHGQPVGGIARRCLRVHRRIGLEIGEPQFLAIAFEAMPQHSQRALAGQFFGQAVDHRGNGAVLEHCFQLVPACGLAGADEGDHLIGEQRGYRVIGFGLTLGIQVVALPEKASLVFAVFTATATQPPERQDTIEYLVFQGLEW